MFLKHTLSSVLCLGALLYISSCEGPKTNPSPAPDQIQRPDSNYVVDGEFGTDTALNTLLEVYRKEKDLKMSKVLTKTKKGLTKERPQSALTNLMADVCLEEAKRNTNHAIDFSIVNYGGIRSSVPKGDVTLEDVYKLMPFDNALCLLEIHRDSVMSMAEYIVRRGGEPISGIQLKIDGETLVDVTINNKPLQTKESYWLATSDYLANGGDRMSFLKNPINRINTNLKVRDALIESFTRQEELNPSTEKRITYVNK